jgi:hypothetical protein
MIGTGGNSGSGGTGTDVVVYGGCVFSGGLNHVTITKKNTTKNLCFSVGFMQPGTPSSGLTLPADWGLQGGNAQVCGSGIGVLATAVSGTASWTATGYILPATADIDVVLSFSDASLPASERLVATGIDLSGSCLF